MSAALRHTARARRAVVPAVADLPLGRNAAAASGGVVGLTLCPGWADVRTIVCGHSHAWALCHALVQPMDRGVVSPGPMLGRRFGLAGLGGGPKDAAYLDRALDLGRTRHLAVMWNGNQHNADFLLQSGPPFNLLPRRLHRAPLQPGVQLVAESEVRAHFAPAIAQLEAFLAAAGRPRGCARFVLGTPPPLHDADLIRARLGQEPEFVARAAALGLDLADVPITPGEVRRKLWLVVQDLMREAAARHRAVFIPAPAACLDVHGCLRPEFSVGDATHASLGYGILALQDLCARLEGLAR